MYACSNNKLGKLGPLKSRASASLAGDLLTITHGVPLGLPLAALLLSIPPLRCQHRYAAVAASTSSHGDMYEYGLPHAQAQGVCRI